MKPLSTTNIIIYGLLCNILAYLCNLIHIGYLIYNLKIFNIRVTDLLIDILIDIIYKL
jgi:hypothetical protein